MYFLLLIKQINPKGEKWSLSLTLYNTAFAFQPGPTYIFGSKEQIEFLEKSKLDIVLD